MYVCIIRMIKSRRTGLVGNVVSVGETRNVSTILVGKPKGKRHSEDLDVDGNEILGWMVGK
jgi:hypothetical protein